MRWGRWLLVPAFATCALVALTPVTSGAAYPDKPITLIVPFVAGGGVDLTARTLGEALKPYLAQPIVVVNKPGGGGTVGAAEVVLSRPDAYTLGITGGSLLIQPHMVGDLPYKGPADYQPVIRAVTVPTIFAVRPDLPWAGMKALLEDAKARPGKIRVGTAGRGTGLGLALEALKLAAGVNLTHVPFGGSAEALTNLLGGHVEAVVVTAAEVRPQAKAGTAKVLAILEDKRIPAYPDAPTAGELGYTVPGNINPYMVFAPKETPEAVLQALHEAMRKAIETEGFRKYAQDNLYLLDLRSRADLRRDLERLDAFCGEMVKQFGLRKK